MWKSVSDAGPRRGHTIALSLVCLAAGLFYTAQNAGLLSGGGIALPKLAWLALAIWCWYCLPALIAADTRASGPVRRAYGYFLANMALRAAAELWMMYVTRNWHPYYGIAHNVFSLGLLAFLYARLDASTGLDALLKTNLVVLGLMFAVELVFVWYMLSHVEPTGNPVYFVPGSDDHRTILWITWAVVAVVGCYLIVFSRRWLRDRTPGAH